MSGQIYVDVDKLETIEYTLRTLASKSVDEIQEAENVIKNAELSTRDGAVSGARNQMLTRLEELRKKIETFQGDAVKTLGQKKLKYEPLSEMTFTEGGRTR